MAVTSGFFDSVDGDRLYNAAQMSNYFEGIVGNGIFENVGNKMIVTAGDGMSVNVGTGRAMINCRWIKNDSVTALDIGAADVQLHRIDAVVLRLDLSDDSRAITIAIKKGTLASTPKPPSITRTESIYELCLAYVSVRAKAAQIKQSDISDQRTNSRLCGYVTGLIDQVDTSELFLQYQTAFTDYYNTMTAQFNAYMAEKQATFEQWYSDLTESLHVDTSVVKYQNSVTTTGTTTAISVGIPEYETGDILLTFANGVLLDDTEYSISGSGDTAKITLVNDIKGDNVITFIVIKGIIGGGVVSAKIDDINGEVI